MAKAFDKVCHSKLLKKMSKLEIGSNFLKWFSSYLTNRFQRTMENFRIIFIQVFLKVPFLDLFYS